MLIASRFGCRVQWQQWFDGRHRSYRCVDKYIFLYPLQNSFPKRLGLVKQKTKGLLMAPTFIV